jgi:hypothetical protein
MSFSGCWMNVIFGFSGEWTGELPGRTPEKNRHGPQTIFLSMAIRWLVCLSAVFEGVRYQRGVLNMKNGCPIKGQPFA